MSPEIKKRFLEGIRKFNEGKYYECHDIFEDVWFAVRGKDRSFYQGLIHLSVGFYHITEKKNSLGAKLQLSKGLEKLRPYEHQRESIEISKMLRKVQKCLDALELNPDAKEFDSKLIPKIVVL